MTNEGLRALRLKLIEAIEAATPDDGLLRTGTGVAFWRERTFLSIASILEEAVRTTYTEAIEEAAKLLDEREAACSKEAQRFADAEKGTENNMYWRADGASDALEQCAFELRRLISSSHGETEGEGT